MYHIYFILLGILLLSTFIPGIYRHYIIIKTLTSLTFLLIALINTYINPKDNTLLLLIPIIMCAIGDIFLAIYNRFEKGFIPGLISFLFAHIFFVFNIWHISPFDIIDVILPLLSVITVYLLDYKGIIVLKRKRIPCMIYAFFVTLLLSKGIDTFMINNTIFLATLNFFISDGLLLFMYFRKRNRILHFLNLLTYYLAMYLFTLLLIII